MALTVLFDLDDTLLHTNMREFLPEYFNILSKALDHIASQDRLIKQIHYAVKQMTVNRDPGRLLSDIFAEHFYQPLGTTETACRQDIDMFYAKDFPNLRQLTEKKPEAQELITWCKQQNFTMAIATNPLFPETATRQRIEWAGLNPEDFRFFSTFNNFHFTKPNLAYYAECLGRLGWPDYPAVMVGDNLQYDLLPVEAMGMATFWVDPSVRNPDRNHGQISDVKEFLENQLKSGNVQPLVDNIYTQIATLTATPAVMDTWLSQTDSAILRKKPSPREWSFVELLWHLADSENEINKPQWEQLLSNPDKALTYVDTSSWAEDRKYHSRDPHEAFELFIAARRASLSLIETIQKEGLLNLTIDHTIFSKIKISELVAFSVKHDRIHLRQCAALLNI